MNLEALVKVDPKLEAWLKERPEVRYLITEIKKSGDLETRPDSDDPKDTVDDLLTKIGVDW